MTSRAGRLSVLYVAPGLPARAVRGYHLRARHHVAALTRRHDVTLLSLEEGGAADPETVGGCRQVVRLPLGRRERAAGLIRAALTGRPLQAGLYGSPRVGATVRALLAGGSFDVLHVQLVRLAAAVPVVPGTVRVLDLVDALSLNMAARARVDRGPLRWLVRREAHRLARLEREACAVADATLVSAPRDRAALGASPRVHLVANGVDLDHFRPGSGPREAGLVVLTGNLGYFPTVHGAAWLVREVWPRVRRAAPGARLVLAGARPARRLRRLAAGQPDVRVDGPVDDLAARLRAARVAVAPLFAGSGQPLKVLEAMASATPVVATPGAVEGLDVVDGEHLLSAWDAPGFASAVARLLSDGPLADRLAERARRLVAARFSWPRSAAALESAYQEALGRGDPSRRAGQGGAR